LILAGILLLPFMIGLGVVLESAWGKLGFLAGLWAAISVALVGVYPMNNLQPHSRAAMSYFRSGLVTVLLFGAAILIQLPEQTIIPKIAILLSALAVCAYASFLIIMQLKAARSQTQEILDPKIIPARPRFWLLPFLEWLVLISTLLWFFGVGLLIQV
jgi:hypothetical membrane protein